MKPAKPERHINICKNGHYYVLKDYCPLCGETLASVVSYRSGDCIKCGELCPEYAYACKNPDPELFNYE